MKKLLFPVIALSIILLPCLVWAEGNKFVLLSSTIGPIDSGIVEVLENSFEKETGIRVRHVGAGTGAALNIARKGNIDLVMAHAKSLEEKFVQEGFGTERIDLMYNDFIIVGPADDPAGIRGIKSAAEALKKIVDKQAIFISRGDKSGTHVAEMVLWEKAGLKPSGSWYTIFEKGFAGNAPTLRFTDQKKAYTVIDRATFLAIKNEIKLDVLVEKDNVLLNYITLIPVNPKKFPKVNYEDTMIFVKWLISPDKGQAVIKEFGKDKYGNPLFFPNSKEWIKAQEISK
ncbi:MAG TPA: substrate-binding domain-containing protein [Syntrophorhabdaceae bacterium]|jgi:tungstate transport system substrate-binding protein|nr:substrate-binding domain-containing protein [Syntrophorhabdaceae bacterium]MBV6505892.1 Tungstate-binding protein TupA [Syntrophorhabdaceae bacterium]HNQ63180.1 substrate-binding domain-containing protein [Syntrophorhabdaceae bacterium]HQG49905.1 substrate-binding domain-containing protein [Syntrophorhabdaceae bacterium]HQI56698.1 substrate-binding domain-containing protein [Syntrophorhabdaceae bacterium]